jgi:hypothetical protein
VILNDGDAHRRLPRKQREARLATGLPVNALAPQLAMRYASHKAFANCS